MNADPIRALLAEHVQTAGFRPRVAPGMVVVHRRRIEHTEADVDAVDAWVIEHGGYLGSDPDYREHNSVAAYGGIQTGATYYAVPSDALK